MIESIFAYVGGFGLFVGFIVAIGIVSYYLNPREK